MCFSNSSGKIEELVIIISLVCSVVDIPWKRGWQPTPVFLPAESHGQRRLAGYSLQDRKESDMAEATQHTCVQTYHGLWSQRKLSQLLYFLAVSSWESLWTSLSIKGFFKGLVVRIRRMTFNISSTVPGTHDWSSMNGKYYYDG